MPQHGGTGLQEVLNTGRFFSLQREFGRRPEHPQETILTLLIIVARFEFTRTLFPAFQIDFIQA
ncbi:MAG: hypothetical protein ACLTNK_07200, partial [Akkermansia muciniphila]